MIAYLARLPFRMARAALRVPIDDALRASHFDQIEAYMEAQAASFEALFIDPQETS